ncbi:MAG: PqqD family protein [Elusimicrobia bacterium]|nr:PqqD family protein [Elusimicrobiota bacterium]
MKLARFVKFREEKFGGVLFETRSEKVYTLSPTAAAVVKEISAGGGPEQVISRLKGRYNDPDGKLGAEAREFIAALASLGLVGE